MDYRTTAVNRAFDTGTKAATFTVKAVIALGVLGGAWIAYSWYREDGLADQVDDVLDAAVGAGLRLAQMPGRIASGVVAGAKALLEDALGAIERTWYAARNVAGSRIGYTSSRGLFAAWKSDSGYVVGSNGSDTYDVAPTFRKQANYDVSKGRLFLPAFLYTKRATNGLLYLEGLARSGGRLAPDGWAMSGHSQVESKTTGMAWAVNSYRDQALRASGSNNNLAYLLGRECYKSSHFRTAADNVIKTNRGWLFLKTAGLTGSDAERVAFRRGFDEGPLPLEVS